MSERSGQRGSARGEGREESAPAGRPPLVHCPHCGMTVPEGDFCGHCGAHLTSASTSRRHAFAAVPSESVAHLSIITTLFPHLPHRRGGAFRWALLGGSATVVVDFDNKEVIIPNKAFITERVINWTLSDQTTRLLIKIGVAYGSDIALVQRLILDVVRGNRDVLQDPSPSVYLVAFGDSTLDFEIRAFVDSLDKRLRVQHEINIEVARLLRENDIEIPFPQRDLHIRSAPGLVGALRSHQRG